MEDFHKIGSRGGGKWVRKAICQPILVSLKLSLGRAPPGVRAELWSCFDTNPVPASHIGALVLGEKSSTQRV